MWDDLRVFSGDGPARQFESGQQRGGNFSCLCGIPSADHGNLVRCYRTNQMTLDDRCKLFSTKSSVYKLKKGILSPLQNLRKEELVEELENRNIDTQEMLRSELQEKLVSILHGVSRPPALMMQDPSKSSADLHIPNYEILALEPLHDISNVVQNVILELPKHIKDTQAKKDFEHFSQTTIGDKNQIKGSDARLFLVKLAKFADNLYRVSKIPESIMHMINSLVDITNICYSQYESRSPKQVLRLYNQCFLFAINCRNIIGQPSNMTTRRFFGSHFHSLTVHAPETLRLFNLRTIVTEHEERIFGDLRRISENTTNRKAETVCDNAVLRFNCHQKSKIDSLVIQESTITRQAHLLPAKQRSQIPFNILTSRPNLVQAHLERISDFLLPGEDVWWHKDQDQNLVFHDGPDDPTYNKKGPSLSHFRNSSLFLRSFSRSRCLPI